MAVTAKPVQTLDTILGGDVLELAVMNPEYPLHTERLEPGQDAFQRVVDLKQSFEGTDTAEVRMNVVGTQGDRISDASFLLNGEPFPCKAKERCRLLAGEYLFQAATGSAGIDSIKFNGERISKTASILRLKSPSEGFKFNTLLLFAH